MLKTNRNALSKEQLIEYREAFCLFDINGDGCITTDELGTVIRSLGQTITEAEIQEMIKHADKDGNGTIEFNEFIELFTPQQRDDEKEEELRKAFKIFDRDNRGYITTFELRRILTSFGERMTNDECDEILLEADIDGNGKIDYDEFVKMLKS